MTATNEPAGQQAMTSERLAVIERHLRSANNDISRNREETVDILRYSRDVTALLAEVERLRTREAALLAEREQAMAIVRAVAYERAFYISGTHAADSYCAFCDQPSEGGHAGGCEVIHARALLASEQEGGGDGG